MGRVLGPLLLSILAWSGHATAGESYDNCSGFIDSLPATIASEGVWCLRRHLYTSQTSGIAINVDAENVTIDCNGFRLSGLGGGAQTQAYGIANRQDNRTNATVRHCRVQGFFRGVYLSGTGHRVEHNSFDLNTVAIELITHDLTVIRHNRINDAVGRAGYAPQGIRARYARIEDNVLSGALVLEGQHAFGIDAEHSLIRRNSLGGYRGTAIRGAWSVMADNIVRDSVGGAASGLDTYQQVGICRGNVVQGYTTAVAAACLAHDNAVQP